MVMGRLCTLLGVLLCAGCVNGFAAQPAGLQRGFALACRWRMAAATQPSKTEKQLEPRKFLNTLLSSRTPQAEKTQLMDAARQLRGKSQDEYIAFLDSLLTEVDSVSDNSWAMRRWAIPLPSYRTKLGTLNRMLNSLLQEGIDENVRRQGVRARTLAVLVRQLETVKGVRALEAEALHGKSTATMADMLRRTPEGLETPSYKVKAEKGSWEVREYEEFSVCSFEMGESPAQAGFGAFNSLAGYIFGGNQESVKMAMTTPVINHGTSNKMSFVMPSSYWKQNRVAPTPMPDSGVKLEERGGGMIGKGSQVAVMWFGGFASKDAVAERKASLKSLLNKDPDWRAVDDAEDPLLLQYNDPFVPPWKRRNEVVLTVTARSPSQPAEQPASVRAERVGVVSQGQTPPAALLELPKAKLEAVAANRRQWGVGVQVPRAKQEAREVNMRQWGIAEDPARDLSGDMTQKSIEALGDVEFAALERLMLLDLDGDGMVDVKEFKTAVCKTGITEDEAREMFRVLDIDANGSISFAEFVKAVQREVALKKPIGVSDPKAPAMMDFESRLNEIRLGRTATLTQKLMGKD